MGAKGGTGKTCYCHTCNRVFHPLGIMRHIAMHREKEENCKITFTYGDTYDYNFSNKKERNNNGQ